MKTPDHMHRINETGFYSAWWNNKDQLVEIRAERQRSIDENTYPAVRVAQWPTEPDLGEMCELINNENMEVGPLSADEIIFLLDVTQSVDSHLENAARDIEDHGEIMVTY